MSALEGLTIFPELARANSAAASGQWTIRDFFPRIPFISRPLPQASHFITYMPTKYVKEGHHTFYTFRSKEDKKRIGINKPLL